MKRRTLLDALGTALLQALVVYLLMGYTLCCSSSSEPGDSNDVNNNENGGATRNEPPPGPEPLSLHNKCYSCTQSLATGDTCGSEMITGSAGRFSFQQYGNNIILNINDQIELTGTYRNGVLDTSNDRVSYIGPGCNMTFTDLELSADIATRSRVDNGWNATFAYDVAINDDEEECASFSFTSCHAVHNVTCTAGCNNF